MQLSPIKTPCSIMLLDPKIEFLPIFTFLPNKTLLPNFTLLNLFLDGFFNDKSGKSISAEG